MNTISQTVYLSGATVEDLARAWASIDGERAGFDSRDPDLGFYEGYITETEEVLKRAVGYAKARDEQFNIDLDARLTNKDRVVALVPLRGSDIYDCKTKAKRMTSKPITLEEARELAAQCWCGKTTENIEMDVALAEQFALLLMKMINTPWQPIETAPKAGDKGTDTDGGELE